MSYFDRHKVRLQKFNPYHDPETGRFTSRENALASFNTEEEKTNWKNWFTLGRAVAMNLPKYAPKQHPARGVLEATARRVGFSDVQDAQAALDVYYWSKNVPKKSPPKVGLW